MNTKISLQEIASRIATRSGLSKKKAETFIRCFFDQVTSSLSEEQYVKIKYFGTFKTIMVEERESININTGERISIEKHSKVSFVPDNFIKELVNRPFSQFETEILEDNTSEFELQKVAAAVDDEFKNAHDSDDNSEKLQIEEQATATSPNSEINIEKEEVHETLPPPPLSNIAEIQEPQHKPSDISSSGKEMPQRKNEQKDTPVTPCKKNKTWKTVGYILAAILILTIGYVFAKFVLADKEKDSPKTENIKANTVSTTDDAALSNPEAQDAIPNSVQTAETLPYSPVTKGPKGRPMKIDGYLGAYELKKGDFIFRIAQKVYGDADMGRYIIEYNNIENPDIVPPGTIIKLPKLTDAD